MLDNNVMSWTITQPLLLTELLLNSRTGYIFAKVDGILNQLGTKLMFSSVKRALAYKNHNYVLFTELLSIIFLIWNTCPGFLDRF